jgi:hypothetical protein
MGWSLKGKGIGIDTFCLVVNNGVNVLIDVVVVFIILKVGDLILIDMILRLFHIVMISGRWLV